MTEISSIRYRVKYLAEVRKKTYYMQNTYMGIDYIFKYSGNSSAKIAFNS